MSPEAILHGLELVDAVDAFWFVLRVYEAGKGFPEFGTAGTMSHSTKARAIPVNFASDRIEGSSGSSSWYGCFTLPFFVLFL